MAVIVIRLLIVWVLLTAVVRFMGKRQIGEMQMSEFITAFMLSELAALPVADSGIPLLFSVVPILLLACLEILTSWSVMRSAAVQKLISGRPSVVIRMGEIDQAVLRQSRMTVSELMAELRQKNVPDPADVAYAILEENGKLSVIPKKSAQPPSAADLSRQVKETGICHTVISDGAVSAAGLSLCGRTLSDIRHLLKQNGYEDYRDIWLMTVDDAGTCRVVRKQNGMGKKRGQA